MKRKLILVVYFIVLCFTIVTLYKIYKYYNLPEFYFYSSMSFENGDGRRTDQSVIVTQNWYDENLIERIEKKFVSMNGHPNELKI